MEESKKGKTYHPNSPHRMMDPPRPQSALDDLEPSPFPEDDVLLRDTHVRECDVAMAMRRIVVAHGGQHPLHLHAGCVGRDEDDGLLLVGVLVLGRGLAHHDVEFAAGVAGAGGPPFLFGFMTR
jgi:hypothetical protein